MLKDAEAALIYKGARVPEQLPHYVESISGQTPHLHEGYVVFTLGARLTLIGYPLSAGVAGLENTCETACRRFRPETLFVIAPDLSFLKTPRQAPVADDYFRLELPCPPLEKKRAYMIRRAAREVAVHQGAWSPAHQKIVSDFIQRRQVDSAYAALFSRIPRYLASAESACLLEARKGRALAAFTVADFGSADYAFYMYHFRSETDFVPGASDLLLWTLAERAAQTGKSALNLGLGINEGNRRFKERWGGVSFLKYKSAAVDCTGSGWRLLGRMIRQITAGGWLEGKK